MDSNWISYLSRQLDGLSGIGSSLPAIWAMLGLIVASLFLTWMNKDIQRYIRPIVIVGVLAVMFLEAWSVSYGMLGSGMLAKDFLGQGGGLLLLMALLVVLLMLPKEKTDPEFFPLMLGGVFGATLAITTWNLLFMILALELLSLVSYVMVAMENRDKANSRAALQYLFFGLFSSALSLYGLSWLYGLTGTFEINTPAFIEGINGADSSLLLPIFLLLMGTFMFKLSAFPFHFWTPEVYGKASYPLMAYLSTIPKIAGAFVFLRFFHILGQSDHGGELQLLVLILAGVSMTWGNLSALSQEHFKTMMAFSGVAHAGYILMGMAWMTSFGEAAVVFYVAAYVFMNLGAILAANGLGESDHYPTWRGKSAQSLFPAINLMVHLVALTGLPPSAGFVGKLYLFSSGVESMEEINQVVVISILSLAVINTLLSLFYYLKPAVWIFLRKGEENMSPIGMWWLLSCVLGLLSLLVILFGIFGFDRIFDLIQLELWK